MMHEEFNQAAEFHTRNFGEKQTKKKGRQRTTNQHTNYLTEQHKEFTKPGGAAAFHPSISKIPLTSPPFLSIHSSSGIGITAAADIPATDSLQETETGGVLCLRVSAATSRRKGQKVAENLVAGRGASCCYTLARPPGAAVSKQSSVTHVFTLALHQRLEFLRVNHNQHYLLLLNSILSL